MIRAREWLHPPAAHANISRSGPIVSTRVLAATTPSLELIDDGVATAAHVAVSVVDPSEHNPRVRQTHPTCASTATAAAQVVAVVDAAQVPATHAHPERTSSCCVTM
jgi:hypothetical protein